MNLWKEGSTAHSPSRYPRYLSAKLLPRTEYLYDRLELFWLGSNPSFTPYLLVDESCSQKYEQLGLTRGAQYIWQQWVNGGLPCWWIRFLTQKFSSLQALSRLTCLASEIRYDSASGWYGCRLVRFYGTGECVICIPEFCPRLVSTHQPSLGHYFMSLL